MLDALIAEQQRLGLTDQAFADVLDVPRQTWNAAKIGKRPLSIQLVRRAMKHFPQLRKYADIFLTIDDTKVAKAHTLSERKEPSNIDVEASEATRNLVLTGDRQTLACRGAAPAGQGQGGRMPDRTNVLKAPQCYVATRPSASDLTSRAVSRVGECG